MKITKKESIKMLIENSSKFLGCYNLKEENVKNLINSKYNMNWNEFLQSKDSRTVRKYNTVGILFSDYSNLYFNNFERVEKRENTLFLIDSECTLVYEIM